MERIELRFNKSGNSVIINLERRLTYITGLSGAGKTTLLTLLTLGSSEKAYVFTSLPIIPVAYNTIQLIASTHDSIIFIDDYASLQSTDILKYIKDYVVQNNLWVVIVGRERFEEEAQIPLVSFSSVYVLKASGAEFVVNKLAEESIV